MNLKFLSLVFILSACGGGGSDNKAPDPANDTHSTSGLEYQSPHNSTSCKNTNRPSGKKLEEADIAKIAAKQLVLETANVYVELRRADGSVLSNVKGTLTASEKIYVPASECATAGDPDSVRVAGDQVPATIDLVNAKILTEVDYRFPLIGANKVDTIKDVPGAIIQNASEPNLTQWLTNMNDWGSVEVYDLGTHLLVMSSYKSSPMLDNTSWFQFALGKYKIVQ